ncbi:hypothetical protein E1287_27660 [Actinomadura sp. KC06]|uniref:hypothetical protein n=1 Tax=Actinomadura sp. KC06 TaxID=2530369 RepID=UPI0010476C04|nr:hypothetical protein [Actinomadura sp. KC06]TDD31084.1 hypothetical protein E1287_27660 [Actinomadura sp. KC06]
MNIPPASAATVAWSGWWRQWPLWAGYVAGGWALLYGGVLLAIALGGRTLYDIPYLVWVAVAALFMGASLALAAVREWGRRLPPLVVSVGLWTMVVLSLAGSAFVLLNLIELAVDGTVRDRDGRSDWEGLGQRLGFAVAAALFLATALSWRHCTRNSCPRCGRPAHPPGSVPAVVRPAPPAPGRIRRIAHLGSLAVVPTTPATCCALPMHHHFGVGTWRPPATCSFRPSPSAPRFPPSFCSRDWYANGG